MKKVLITGATGFIGKHLVNHLKRNGCQVVIFAKDVSQLDPSWKQNVQVYEGNITDLRAIGKIEVDFDVVFHLVAEYIHHSPKTKEGIAHIDQVILGGTKNILEKVKGFGGHFIFFSSISVYDGIVTEERITEETEIMPNNDYGRNKMMAERLVVDYGKKYRFMTTSLRLPFVYGPGNKGNIAKMITAVDAGRFILIGKGTNRRSPVYVGNVIDAALKIMGNKNADGKCYIVTDGKDYTLNELYAGISNALGRSVLPFYIPLPIAKTIAKLADILEKIIGRSIIFNTEVLWRLIRTSCFSSEKLQQEIGYAPRYDFHGSIAETVNWYKEHK